MSVCAGPYPQSGCDWAYLCARQFYQEVEVSYTSVKRDEVSNRHTQVQCIMCAALTITHECRVTGPLECAECGTTQPTQGPECENRVGSLVKPSGAALLGHPCLLYGPLPPCERWRVEAPPTHGTPPRALLAGALRVPLLASCERAPPGSGLSSPCGGYKERKKAEGKSNLKSLCGGGVPSSHFFFYEGRGGGGPHLHEHDFGRTIRGPGGALLLLLARI